MGQYKGINIPDKLVELISAMEDLDQSREELSVLGQQWDLLTILGQMSGSGTDMSATREEFKTLTSELLSTLGIETLKKTVQSLGSKAQVTVDIVIRNLFERTADIGFLATDDDVRSFLKNAANDNSDFEVEILRNRFAEYVSKYSVYNDIILMNPEGKILCQLRTDIKTKQSNDAIIKEALSTNKEFVERFAHSDLNPADPKSLMYAFRVRESADPTSAVIGVLCLVFRFQDELEMVFKNLIDSEDWTVLALLDSEGTVIACSDSTQVALGSKVSFDTTKDLHIGKFGGRRYLSKTCPTNGYQGFKGLGWYGHAMIPLECAFSKNESSAEPIPSEVISAVTENKSLFSEELRQIPLHAEEIQSELDRTVWNGNVREDSNGGDSSSSARKVLLWEISTTGNKTRSVFERSIGGLHETVVSSIFSDSRFVANLAIDIMDRNLYERANDCRWWSLTTAFKQVLSKTQVSSDDSKKCSDILAYINGLYTVYTNLFLFDRNGKIIAVSKKSEESMVGKILNDDYIKTVLTQADSQNYSVSGFSKTELYNNKHTYVFAASITDISNANSVVGGVGIVFDSEPQFHAMLNDSLPHLPTGEVVPGYEAVYVDRHRHVISSTSAKFGTGSEIDLPEEFFQVANGQSMSKAVLIGKDYYAIGASCSKGYREFKGPKDRYKNDILCITFTYLGQALTQDDNKRTKEARARVEYGSRTSGVPVQEFATFYVNNTWLGFEKKNVVECIKLGKLTPLPGYGKEVEGSLMFNNQPICVVNPSAMFGSSEVFQPNQIVVVRSDENLVGVLVNDLGEIPEVPETFIVKQGLLKQKGNNDFISAIVKPAPNDPDSRMLVILEPSHFFEAVLNGKSLDRQKLGIAPALDNSATNDRHEESSTSDEASDQKHVKVLTGKKAS